MLPSKRLWDANACLAYLIGEEGADDCQATLDAVDRGQVELYISTLAIAETLMLRGKTKLPVSKKLTVRNFMQRFIPVEIDRRCAEYAQDLVWDFGIKPRDAIHTAAAVLAGCEILETFDTDLLKKSEKVGDVPPLKILRPGYDFTLPLKLVAPAT